MERRRPADETTAVQAVEGVTGVPLLLARQIDRHHVVMEDA